LSKKDKLLQAAQKNINKGQWLKAAKEFQKVLELDPKDMRSRQRMAELFSRAGMSAESMQAYEVVARHYADNGFYLKAIAVYKQMQKIDPSEVKIYERLAELNEKQGLVGNALGEYRHLAELQDKSGNVEELKQTLLKMQELDPNNTGLRLRICQNYLQNGMSDKTREVLQETLDLLEKIKDPDATGRFKDLILSHVPDDISLKAGVARVMLLCNQPEEVVTLLAGDVEQTSEQKQVLPVLALAYRQMKDFASERQLYELLLAAAPNDLDYQESYARACLDSGDDQDALERLEVWKDSFLRNDRTAVLKELYEQLQVMRGDDERVRQSLHQIYENTGEGSKLFDLLSGDDRKRHPGENVAADEDGSGAWFGNDANESREGDVFAAQETQDPEDADASALVSASPLEEKEPFAEETEYLAGDGHDDLLEGLLEDSQNDSVAASSFAPDRTEDEDDGEIELELDLDLDACEGETPLEELPEADLVEEIEPLEDDEELILGAETRESGRDEIVDDTASSEDTSAAESPIGGPAEGESISAVKASGDADFSDVDDELANMQKELGEVFEMDSFDLEDDDDEPDLTSDLEEAEFYLQQEFLDEALKKCQSLLEQHPDHREVTALLQQVQERMLLQQRDSDKDVGDQPAGASFDTAEKPSESKEQNRLEGNISAFKKGIEDAVAQDDCETHYELGIAYKEMGLFDEAIEEFDKAMIHPSRYIDALTLTGICLASKGSLDRAAELFKKGLSQEGLDEGDRLNLHFELGQLYVSWGRPLEALDSFEQVADADLSYRDVGDQVRKLREELGLDDDGDAGGPGGGSGSNRVSYL